MKFISNPKNKGFTLIELLVVISIIGLLSSVVLAATGSARDKGKFAAAITFADHTYHAYGADAIAIWNFNGATGLEDLSGNNHTLINFGATIDNTSTFNSKGKSLRLDGSNYLKSSLVDSINFGTAGTNFVGTVGAWIRTPNSYGVWQVIASNIDYGDFFFATLDNKIAAYSWTGGQFGVVGPNLNDDKWHYVAITFRSNTSNGSQFYVDGQPVGSPFNYVMKASTDVSGQNYFDIGGDRNQSQCFGRQTNANNSCSVGGSVYSYIDDVSVYSQALTALEVQKVYAEGLVEHNLAVNSN